MKASTMDPNTPTDSEEERMGTTLEGFANPARCTNTHSGVSRQPLLSAERAHGPLPAQACTQRLTTCQHREPLSRDAQAVLRTAQFHSHRRAMKSELTKRRNTRGSKATSRISGKVELRHALPPSAICSNGFARCRSEC
jgi:hypothetical protein